MPGKPPRKNQGRKRHGLVRELTAEIKLRERERTKPYSRRAFADCYEGRLFNIKAICEYFPQGEKTSIEYNPEFRQAKRIEIYNATRRLKAQFNGWKDPMLAVDSHYAIRGFLRWAKTARIGLEKTMATELSSKKRTQLTMQAELLEKLLETGRMLERTSLLLDHRARFVNLLERKAMRKTPEKRTEFVVGEMLQAAEDIAEHSLDKFPAFRNRKTFETENFESEAKRISAELAKDFGSLLERKELFPEKNQAIKETIAALKSLVPQIAKRVIYLGVRGEKEIELLRASGATEEVVEEIHYRIEREKAIFATIRTLSEKMEKIAGNH